QHADTALPRSQNLSRGMKVCYEKSKSCLDGCDNYYDKHLYSWYGSIQRQLQRSQYQLQYNRPVQIVFSLLLLLCLLVFMAFRSI
ncbi:t-snare, partial [Genlisea aurea]